MNTNAIAFGCLLFFAWYEAKAACSGSSGCFTRTVALTPEQVASPMAARPYDLRDGAVSLWPNGGVAVTEVADRAGHSVEILLRVDAK